MDSAQENRHKLLACTVPMAVFLAALALVSLLKAIGGSAWLNSPQYWVYPLQTFICGALLFRYRRVYDLARPRRLFFTLAIATLVFVLWISPQEFFALPPRVDGFNPDIFAGQRAAYWATVFLRFLRLVAVVPLVEEVFWRGFLLRYFIDERFDTVPFGSFSRTSFVAVTLGFTLVHSSADWPAAAVTGALYNVVAYRTKSLSSCVLAHALTNLLLGLWIMRTGQWGFW